ncbi:MAG: type VI secretion system ATPase TssH, partial [Calditrichaeota bacterium]
DDEHAMVRIDMSEYMERHAVSRLIGAPPGYVGYEEGGQLTEAVRRRPYSVILMDEIEKAHPEVFNILLQLLDDGRLTDNQGRTVNFNNTLVIMTSNIGGQYIMEQSQRIDEENHVRIHEEITQHVRTALKQHFRPEFLNRVDDLIVFHALGREELKQIVKLQLRHVEKLLAEKQLSLDITTEAEQYLADQGYDPAFGARPLKRLIQKQVINPLSLHILEGRYHAGDIVHVVKGENSLDFK